MGSRKIRLPCKASCGYSPQLNILFIGSPAEQEIIRKIFDLLPEEVQKKAKIRTPDQDKLTSIKRLMSDCKHAKLVLTNDTGPMHIAAKYGVKTLCMTGGWHWGVFSPCKEYKSVEFLHHKMSCYGCGGSCKYGSVPFKCLQELTAEKVLLEKDF
ncbi:MAG: glycosyltransferase family 9 protein [Lentisphaerae bacterium]|nr:glycosyltransferase family 9 protein [Lentisphaerota bacterium]